MTYKVTAKSKRSSRGFTLLEILGVIGIIGLLAAITVPSIIKARRSGAIASVIGTVKNVSTGVGAFCQKPGGPGYPPLTEAAAVGSFTLNTGNATLIAATPAAIGAASTLDNLLLAERAIESPISVGIGSQNNTPSGSVALTWDVTNNYFNTNPAAAPTQSYAAITRVECYLSSTATPGTDGTNFYLDASSTNLATNSRVVTLVIPGVLVSDAAALSNAMDNRSNAPTTGANTVGRVTWAAPAATGLTTVYVYVTHI